MKTLLIATAYSVEDLCIAFCIGFIVCFVGAIFWRYFALNKIRETTKIERLIGQILVAYNLLSKKVDVDQNRSILKDLIPFFARTIVDCDVESVRRGLLFFKGDFVQIADAISNIKNSFEIQNRAMTPSSPYGYGGPTDEMDHSMQEMFAVALQPKDATSPLTTYMTPESAALAIEKLFIF